jgi:putative oxygen-independent coproporphyrinogen III oxidase
LGVLILLQPLSTSLYIHTPWCIKKCPYCDFNSHQSQGILPERAYVDQLLLDFSHDLAKHPRQSLKSIFIGGGTPSLLSPEAYAHLFDGLKALIELPDEMEITLEANPGTLDIGRFKAYRELGINRLSIGIQSFQDHHLKALGRIHDATTARAAVEAAQDIGFHHINIDLMYALPNQTLKEACQDLEIGIALQPHHLSWYELTIEPNTVFYKRPPSLPQEDLAIQIEEAGQLLLAKNAYERYEISAYARDGAKCQHNLNYWMFGDYFGIGAGAHSKLTLEPGLIERSVKWKMPQRYLSAMNDFSAQTQVINHPADLHFEFFLNAARLLATIPLAWFEAVTGSSRQDIMPTLQKLADLGLIHLDETQWRLSKKGVKYSNEVVNHFLV